MVTGRDVRLVVSFPMCDLPLVWTPGFFRPRLYEATINIHIHRLVGTCVHPERMLRNMPSAYCTIRCFLRNCRRSRRAPTFGCLASPARGKAFSFFNPSLYVNLSYKERLPDAGLACSPYTLTFTSLSVNGLFSFSNILKAGLTIKV